MRRNISPVQIINKQNRYDQYTNLGIDLQANINRSIILPKIYNKIAELQAGAYMRARKIKEESSMSSLKEQINRLRRQIYNLEDKKIQRFRTEEAQYSDQVSMRLLKQSLHLSSNQNLRNSIQPEFGLKRQQRNTDKQAIHRNNQNNSIHLENYEIQQSNSFMNLPNPTSQHLKKNNKMPNEPRLYQQEPQQQQQQQVRIQKKIPKKPNPRLKRKFRVAVMAVFFTLLLPAFSGKLYQNRLRTLMKQYPHQIGKYFNNKDKTSKYKMDEAKLWVTLEQRINLLDSIQRADLSRCLRRENDAKLIKEHFQFLINNQMSNSSDKEVKQHQTLQQQLMYPKNLQFIMNGYQNILTKSLETLSLFINKSDFFTQRWKTFSLGLINNSFIHNSHPKLPQNIIDSGIVRLHPFKQILLVLDKQTQCLLLAFDIVCRIMVYKWFIKLQKLKPKLDPKNQQSKSQKTTTTEENRILTSFMLSILYLIAEQTINDLVKNFAEEYGTKENSLKNRSKFIRPIVPLIVKTDRRRDQKLFTQPRLIANPPLQEQANQAIKNNPAFVEVIQQKIKKIGYDLYDKLKVKMKQQWVTIRNQTIQEKNTISKSVSTRTRKIEVQDSQPVQQSSSVSLEAKIKPKRKN